MSRTYTYNKKRRQWYPTRSLSEGVSRSSPVAAIGEAPSDSTSVAVPQERADSQSLIIEKEPKFKKRDEPPEMCAELDRESEQNASEGKFHDENCGRDDEREDNIAPQKRAYSPSLIIEKEPKIKKRDEPPEVCAELDRESEQNASEGEFHDEDGGRDDERQENIADEVSHKVDENLEELEEKDVSDTGNTSTPKLHTSANEPHIFVIEMPKISSDNENNSGNPSVSTSTRKRKSSESRSFRYKRFKDASQQVNLTSGYENIFVGNPLVFKLCQCDDHVCPNSP